MWLIGSANMLNLDDYPSRRTYENLDPNDPIMIKQNLGLNEVTERLFSTITTGVRYWPFLLVARDLRKTKSRRVIESTLKKINSVQEQKNIGPLKFSTFRPYRSMYGSLSQKRDVESENLRYFIRDKRRKYDGNFDIFQRSGNEKNWKKALVKSMGVPGRQFAKLLDQLLRDQRLERYIDESGESIVDVAITRILRNKSKFHELLWKGAFCYAFLRNMYGINELGNFFPPTQSRKWSRYLIEILKKNHPSISGQLRGYIPLIKSSAESPPWKDKTKEMKRKNRIVLAGIRFNIFYNLYARPTPRRAAL
jgi:hypothetical protein